jgi:hypothetical protein
MNKIIRTILFGLLIWAIPFTVSFFMWDVKANAPIVSASWFSATMAFTFAIGIAIAICFYFRPIKKKDAIKGGWTAGLIWYLVLIIMDYIVLVNMFKMAITDYYPMLLTYLNALAISAGVGYMLANKK